MSNSLLVGELSLTNAYLPSLAASDTPYTISARLTLNLGPNVSGVPAPVTVEQDFIVPFGPRFSLSSDLVYVVNPANGSMGDFDVVIPQIVLKDPHLPWMGASQADTTPGMALIVISPSEASAIVPKTPAKIIAPGPFGSQKITTTDLVQKNFDGVIVPTLGSLPNQGPDSTCNLIAVDAQLFGRFFPSKRSIQYCCHARNINSGGVLVDGLTPNGAFSVVIANRLPNSSGGSQQVWVHLVSLEGLMDYIGTTPANPVCMVSLYSWGFKCLTSKVDDFDQMIDAIANSNSDTSPGPGTSPLHMHPISSSGDATMIQHVNNRLNDGYVPVNYHLISGEDTLAYYRGPLTPQQIQPISRFPSAPGGGPYVAAHSTPYVAYDISTGVFDVTYSTAWQLGRSLALADKNFLESYMEFRRTVYDQTLQISKSRLQVDDTGEGFVSTLHKNKTDFYNVFAGFMDAIAMASNNSNIPIDIRLDPFDHDPVGQRTTSPPFLLREQYSEPQSISDSLSATLGVYTASYPRTLQDSNLDYVLQWLSDLKNLSKIPFHYLVPNPLMLPMESMRFFCVDSNWIAALLSGALSISVHMSSDLMLQRYILATLQQPNPESGFLLRSALVSRHPGLIVRPSSLPGSDITGMLSVTRPDPNTLLSIFTISRDNLTHVTLAEPPEQFHFGLSNRLGDNNAVAIYMRDSTGTIVNGRTLKYGQISSALCSESNTFDYEALANILISLDPTVDDVWKFTLQLIPAPSGVTFSHQPGGSQKIRHTEYLAGTVVHLIMESQRAGKYQLQTEAVIYDLRTDQYTTLAGQVFEGESDSLGLNCNDFKITESQQVGTICRYKFYRKNRPQTYNFVIGSEAKILRSSYNGSVISWTMSPAVKAYTIRGSGSQIVVPRTPVLIIDPQLEYAEPQYSRLSGVYRPKFKGHFTISTYDMYDNCHQSVIDCNMVGSSK